ncbi:MAG: preprotein translocase subunit SecA [Bacteroidetes bacterium]|nr:MAG: preprotein translocase subunit SecA [Bacteroidota bacterium]
MGVVNKLFKSLFGDKNQKDIQKILPVVEEINREFEKLKTLSNDELRQKTAEFKKIIADSTKEIVAQISSLQKKIDDNPELEIDEKEAIYEQIDKLKKQELEKIEETLDKILPQAFAVVKETARRFKENEVLEVTATEFDKELASHKTNVEIEGEKALWHNRWMAAGNEIVWDMVHYDVQLIGGVVLHQGKIAEMQTGEGKTLVATLPVYLNALAGKGVHLVTVNDYLAKRDSEWMGPLFEFHGLRVDCIDKHQPNSYERKMAYLADVTYGTNNEFGFDYLRDNMAVRPEDLVQREHHYAIVDEVDSVLIDDARTPLIISGPTSGGDKHEFLEYKPKVEKLVSAQKQYINTILADAKKMLKPVIEGQKIDKKTEQEAGLKLLRAYRGLPKNKALIKFLSEPGMKALLQKTENYYLQDNAKEMPKVDEELYFVIDEKTNAIELTEKGIELITDATQDPQFFILPDIGSRIAEIEKSNLPPEEKLKQKDELLRDYAVKSERIHTVNQLLRAYTMFEKDVEYVVMDNKVKIVDEQTGRIMEGRRYSDGLHQAIEAKENVTIEAATQTYATITLQNYFRMYHKLAGMTGTAITEAGEFWEIYKLDVVSIPTNKPIARIDKEDLVYKTKREKYKAIIDEIERTVKEGRPVLVGTTSVEVSELLGKMLKLKGIKHQILNAKRHKQEAEIVAKAGMPGTVTIATNMAGRGTDIKLGPGVKEAGGLAIIGTERHESRRVDRQLRGRAGRQGDPGSSQFFVSLEDDLMRLFGSERIARLMDRIGLEEGEVIQHSMITKSIERAQKKVEENNFGIRKRLLEYDDVMNAQREVIYTKRKHALFGERLGLDIANAMYDVCESIVNEYHPQKDYEAFKFELLSTLGIESPVSEEEFLNQSSEEIIQKLYQTLREEYHRKSQIVAKTAYPVIKDVFENQSAVYKNIVVPLTDGIKTIQVVVDLEKAYQTEGKEVLNALERSVMLAIIDEEWKEHLREMDDLRQSVQSAVYEQKDPLLVYKFESFELFKKMLDKINKEVVSFLVKANLPIQNPQEIQEAKQAPEAAPKQSLQTSRTGLPEFSSPTSTNIPTPPQERKPQPVRVEKKVNPNAPCPCGSGKKYKHCHGKVKA